MRTGHINMKTAAAVLGAAATFGGSAIAAPEASTLWKDAANRSTLRNAALEARFQSGQLYRLQDLATGKVLLSIAPEQLPSKIVVFDNAPTDLDSCKVTQKVTRTSVATQFVSADGAKWQTHWRVLPGKGDLVLNSSGAPLKPVEQFRAIFPAFDITEHTVVTPDGYGVGRTATAPWDGSFVGDPEKDSIPGAFPQALIALFQGKNTGWVVEGRDPKLVPANVLIQGHGQTATVGMVRRFPVATAAPQLFEVRMRTYRDHWENALDPYIAWLEKGAGYVPIQKKKPSWIKDIKTQAYLGAGNFEALELLAKRVDPKKTLVGREVGFTKYGSDSGFPDYRVTDVSKKWFKRARELGFHVGAHFNAQSLAAMWPDLVERFKPAFAVTGKDAQGNDTYESIYEGPNKLYRVSAAYKPWRDYLVAQFKDAVDSGVDVIYLDESMTATGKYVIDGVSGPEGMLMLMKQVHEAYPNVAIETEQFNAMTAKYGDFALSQMPLGHPLVGYIYQKYVKVVPEGLMYSPNDAVMMNSFASWGFMLPGANPPRDESGVEITQAFQKYNLVPDSRLPRHEFLKFQSHYSSGLTPIVDYTVPPEGIKLFGYRGRKGVTAYFEVQPNRRGLVVYEPGKAPHWYGTRYSDITSYDGPGLPVYFYFRHTVKDWLIYDDKKMMGLNPAETYWFDESLKRSPTRFHVTKIPADFAGVMNSNKRIPPQEIGADDSFFQLTFTGHGEMSMVVPDDYDVYLNGAEVKVDRATKTATVTVGETSAQTGNAAGPGYVIGNTTMGASPTANNASVLLAVKRSDQLLIGLFSKMPWKHSLDNLAWVEAKGEADFTETMGGIGRISGTLPRATSLRLTGSYHMLEGPGNPGDGVIRINGKEVVRVPHGERPFPTTPFDADISAYAGKHVLIEFLTDGEPGRGNAAEWIAPKIVAPQIIGINGHIVTGPVF